MLLFILHHGTEIVMKKFLAVALLVVLAPACGWRKKNTQEAPQEATTVAQADSQNQIFEGENAEAFVLKEGENPFAPSKDGKLVFIDEAGTKTAAWMTRRAENQAKHGFTSVYFDFDKSEINPAQRAHVAQDLAIVKKLVVDGNTVVVEGHACRFAGSEEYNMMLSAKRAQTVANYLVKNGVPSDKLKVVGRGFEECLVVEGDKEQQAPNRRVEFYVLEETAA